MLLVSRTTSVGDVRTELEKKTLLIQASKFRPGHNRRISHLRPRHLPAHSRLAHGQ
jgi:hypothetical protein